MLAFPREKILLIRRSGCPQLPLSYNYFIRGRRNWFYNNHWKRSLVYSHQSIWCCCLISLNSNYTASSSLPLNSFSTEFINIPHLPTDQYSLPIYIFTFFISGSSCYQFVHKLLFLSNQFLSLTYLRRSFFREVRGRSS